MSRPQRTLAAARSRWERLATRCPSPGRVLAHRERVRLALHDLLRAELLAERSARGR